MKNLQNKVAVITGAAHGIGRALACQLAKKGCLLALLDIRLEDLAKLAAQLQKEFESEIRIYQTDVANKELMEKTAAMIESDFGAIDLLINNAGVSINKPFKETTLEEFEWLMNINFWGTVYGCKFFLPYLEKRKEAHIVNMISELAFTGFPAKSAYTASKFALLGFSNSLYTELFATSVSLTMVIPGPVKTGLIKRGKSQSENQKEKESKFLQKHGVTPEYAAQKIINAIKRKKQRVRIGWYAIFIDYCNRCSTSLVHQSIARLKNKVAFLE